MADRIPMKEEDFYVVSDSGNSYLGLPLDDTKSDYVDKEYEQLKSQILRDHEIVNLVINCLTYNFDLDAMEDCNDVCRQLMEKLGLIQKISDGK